MPHQPFLVGHLEAEPLLLERRVEVPVELREGPQHEAVLAEPLDPVHLFAVREVVAGRLRDGVPDVLDRVRLGHVEAEIVARLVVGQPRPRGAPVDRGVVAFEDADAPRELGGDPGDVLAVDRRVDDRLAHRPALVLPELLGEFGGADLDELETLQVGRLGQQDVGHVVGLVPRVGEGDRERELGDAFGDLGRVPGRDRRVCAVVDPHRGLGLLGPGVGQLLLEQPRQMRRAERGRPGRVGGERDQRLVGVADMRFGRPIFPGRRVERVVHDPVALRPYGEVTVVGRPVELDRGPERPARHFERAHQRRQQGPRPAGLVAAPAVVHPLAQHHRDRAEGQRLALDLDGLADHGVGQVFIGDAADAFRRHVALGLRPFRREAADVVEEELEGGPRLGLLVRPDRAVRALLDARNAVRALQRGLGDIGVERLRQTVGKVEDQRLPGLQVTQIITSWTYEIGRRRVVRDEPDVADLAPVALDQDAVDQGEQEGRVGLRPDRQPFRRQRAGDRKMRFDLDPLEPAHPCVGLAPDAGDTAGGLDVVAAVDDVVAVGRIGRDDEGAVPELAVKMLRMVALHPLPAAEALIDRPPGRHEGGEGPHVLGRRAAAAEAGGEPGQPLLVDDAVLADLAHLRGHDVERLVPGNPDESRVLVPPLPRVGPLHRLGDAVRVVGLLDQPVGLDADPPAAGMPVGDVVVGLDPGGDAVLDLDLEQVRAGDALVTVDRDLLLLGDLRHVSPRPSFRGCAAPTRPAPPASRADPGSAACRPASRSCRRSSPCPRSTCWHGIPPIRPGRGPERD